MAQCSLPSAAPAQTSRESLDTPETASRPDFLFIMVSISSMLMPATRLR